MHVRDPLIGQEGRYGSLGLVVCALIDDHHFEVREVTRSDRVEEANNLRPAAPGGYHDGVLR